MSSIDRRYLRITIATLASVLLFAALAFPLLVRAHAYLESSDPAANAVVPTPPAEARLRFTEPLEESFSTVELYDAQGSRVETEPSQVGADPYEMVLPLPADLPAGTYSLQWRNVSTADGHAQVGYIPFTVGTDADVSGIAVPDGSATAGPPAWVSAIGRWLSLLGAFAAAGGLVCWIWVIQAALADGSAERRDRIARNVTRLVGAGVVVAIVGSIVALGVQADTTSGTLSPESIGDVLLDTRYGRYWMIRVALLVAFGALATAPFIWRERVTSIVAMALSLAAAGIFVPFAMVGHAAALNSGRNVAVAVIFVHLVAASVWIGGLLALLVGPVLGSRGADSGERRGLFATTITRFTTLAIASVIVLTLSGLYSSWLQVGNLYALRQTDYGRTLIVKVLLMLAMVALGWVNQRWIGPRLQTTAGAGQRFRQTIVAEAALGIVLVFMVGLLVSLPTARETVASTADQTEISFRGDTGSARLYLLPGAVGSNQYVVDTDDIDGEMPADSEVLLRFSHQDVIEGVRETTLAPTSANRFEGNGREFSVPGGWALELIVRRPGTVDWRATVEVDIPQQPDRSNIPGPVPRFGGAAAVAAVLVIALAIGLLTIAVRSRANPSTRRLLGTIGTAGTIVAITALAFSSVDEASTADQPPDGIAAADVALAVQVRDFMEATFGSPFQAADWYDNITTISARDGDVTVATDLAPGDESATTARNICRAVANYNLSRMSHGLPIAPETMVDGIAILDDDGAPLYQVDNYADCA